MEDTKPEAEQSEAEQSEDSGGTIRWHDAYFWAFKWELAAYKDVFDFEMEHQLSKEALKIDVLIIKKEKNVEIEKNIGRIFRGYNICECKSETDSFSIWDYAKINGYARLYSAFNKVDEKDITLTVAVTQKPRKLLEYLKSKPGFEITEPYSGIYYITGDTFPVQILETKRLSAEDAPFVRSLRSNLTESEVAAVLNTYVKQAASGYDKRDSFIDTVIKANMRIFEEAHGMSNDLGSLAREIATREGWFAEFEKKGIEKGRQEGREEGIQEAILKFTQLMKKENCSEDLIAKIADLN